VPTLASQATVTLCGSPVTTAESSRSRFASAVDHCMAVRPPAVERTTTPGRCSAVSGPPSHISDLAASAVRDGGLRARRGGGAGAGGDAAELRALNHRSQRPPGRPCNSGCPPLQRLVFQPVRKFDHPVARALQRPRSSTRLAIYAGAS
jgi:hypothetical protein